MAKFGEAHSDRLRVLVLGNTGAGKTSLVNGLLMGESRLTAEEERTEGIELRKWYPDPENKHLELEFWDFGGHIEYQTSHYFIEEHSLFLLVVDVSEYETTDKSYNENIGKWIDEVKSIVLQPVIMVAATKSDLDPSNVNDRCYHMLKNIAEQEKMDVNSVKTDLELLDGKEHSNAGRKEKLQLLATKRPVLPSGLASASDEKEPTNGETVIVVTSAGSRYYNRRPSSFDLISLNRELVRAGSNPNLFPHLRTTLPPLWIEIEELLPTLKEELKNKDGAKYLTFKQLEKWLSGHLQKFNDDVDKEDTLKAVVAYLVKLGKILQFERIKQLKDFIFPDPQWLIMLVKEVFHHDLQSHLEFKEHFKILNMSAIKFQEEKQDLIDSGLLSESLLRCIWLDAVPENSNFKNLVPLLYHFDVGYKMTLKEAKFKDKDFEKNYVLIPALMQQSRPQGIEDAWPTSVSEGEVETKSVYKFHSVFPIGLFERYMVRCHQDSDYMLHWKEGFFGVTDYEKPEEVKFCIRKENDKIEFSTRMRKINQMNSLWMVFLRLHQIFANMVKELWPELRYEIYNICPNCNKCQHEMDFEWLLEAPHSYCKTILLCKSRIPPVKVNNELVFPPQEVVEEFKKNKAASSSVSSGGGFTSSLVEGFTSAGASTSTSERASTSSGPGASTSTGASTSARASTSAGASTSARASTSAGASTSTGASTGASSGASTSTGTSTSAAISSPVMVRDIGYPVRRRICRSLDVRREFEDDFRMLAYNLGLPTSYIEYLSQKENPAEEVLKWWETKREATVKKFREILIEMERNDVQEILDKNIN